MRSESATVVAVSLLVAVMVLSAASTVMADEVARVKALVEKGVKMAETDGKEATLKAIGDPKGPFIDGELYLFAGPLDRLSILAHPYQLELVGKDLGSFKNSKMFSFIADFVKIAKEDGAGWVEYQWPKPGADEPSLKRTYVMRVPGQDMYLACGYYPKSVK